MFRIFEGFSTYYLASVAKGSVTSCSTTGLKNLACCAGDEARYFRRSFFWHTSFTLELNSKLAPEVWNAKL